MRRAIRASFGPRVLLIGTEELDHEHWCLIEGINKLHRDLLEHVDVDRIKDTLGSIHARRQAHFALEEHVMVSHGYPLLPGYYPERMAGHE